ncbi:MAG: hypothetical protein KGJ78_11620 [Alphaproteobacteria bacterium]|nr:hypothetical protein [Alphaproteobacteria bacterium]
MQNVDAQQSGEADDVPSLEGASFSRTTLSRALNDLLISGGDSRLELDPATLSNVYGCQPFPRSDALAFSSSTATSISERAYRRVQCAHEALIEDSRTQGWPEAFDRQVEGLRRALETCFELDGSAIVLSPSGTDSQLHTLFLARQILGGPVTTVIVGADQTGSGTAFTCRGQHFSARTALGTAVAKGAPIEELAGDSIAIALLTPEGTVRTADEVDGAVIGAVAGQVGAGRKVVLHAMESSKLGLRAPSDECLKGIARTWPGAVQIMIDACQMRISRPRIRQYLAQGYIVLVTGSKFFTGPPFCGASLVPASLAARLAAMKPAAGGLAGYATRWDFPAAWRGIRSGFAAPANIGQWLRWTAALEEMRAYYAVPPDFRRSLLVRLEETIGRVRASSAILEPFVLPPQPRADAALDEELTVRTVFPFLVKHQEGHLGYDDAVLVYRALNRDLSGALPGHETPDTLQIAAALCHIGQPVKLPAGQDGPKAVLRLCVGARTVSEAWSSEPGEAERNIAAIAGQLSTIAAKLEIIMRHFDAVRRVLEQPVTATPPGLLRRTA